MRKQNKSIQYFDSSFDSSEQLPREFFISFIELEVFNQRKVQVFLNGDYQVGDIINDNSYENDYYRYHDVFHYTFATILGWSPCSRVLMKKKRKSNPLIDEVEDGARATITEEAISLIIFNEAKRKNFFENGEKISRTVLRTIKEMTENFEVKLRTTGEWELAIQKGYEIFRQLIRNNGGKVFFNMRERKANYLSSAN